MSKVRIRNVTLFLIVPFLSGCIAAAAPLVTVLGLASGAWVVTKTYQSATSGDVSIGFTKHKESIKDQAALSTITSPAIWPSSRADPLTADLLAKQNIFKTVITPIAVAESITKNGMASNLNLMTDAEVGQTFAKTCQNTGSDSVVYLGDPVIKGDTNFFSFKSPALVFESRMLIYVCQTRTFVYQGARRLEVEETMPGALGVGGTTQSGIPDDVVQFVAEATMEELVTVIAPSNTYQTVQSQPSTSTTPPIATSASKGFDADVAELQLQLTKRGYSPGPIDGLWGGQTRKALEKFQLDNSLPTSGKLDDETRAALFE